MNRNIKMRNQLKKNYFYGILILAITYILCVLLSVYSTIPEQIDMQAGDIAKNTITAPKDIVDQYSTELLRQEEMQKVKPVYQLDEEISQDVMDQISSDMQSVYQVQSELYSKVVQTLQSSYVSNFEYDPASIDPGIYLTDSQLEGLKQKLPSYLQNSLTVILKCKPDETLNIQTLLLEQIQQEYQVNGVNSDDIAAYQQRLKDLVYEEYEDHSYVGQMIDNIVVPNLIYDAQATEEQKEKASASVEDIVYKEGQNIITKGEVVTTAQLELLKQIGIAGQTGDMMLKNLYVAAYMLVLFIVYGAYLARCEKQLFQERKKATILAVLTLLGVLLFIVLRQIGEFLLPTVLIVLLAGFLVDWKIACSFGIFLSLLLAGCVRETNGYFISVNTTIILCLNIVGSVVALLGIKKYTHRGVSIIAGLAGGIVMGVLYLIIGAIESTKFSDMLTDILMLVFSGFICGTLCVGLLPVFEFLFKVVTASRLLELTNPNSKLLKELMIKAPGTYHHSIMVANLAEAACERLDANSLLARAAAYYHDVGKLKNPLFFKENQIGVSNPHDELPPAKSAQIIINHVKDGLELADKYKLPKEIKDVMMQHHGGSRADYFYLEAKKENEFVDEEQFTYPYAKPNTVEASVVMLADTAEAAIRAFGMKDMAKIRQQLMNLFKSKLDAGILEQAPITFKDLQTIADAFLDVFKGAIHERVKYPGQEEADQ